MGCVRPPRQGRPRRLRAERRWARRSRQVKAYPGKAPPAGRGARVGGALEGAPAQGAAGEGEVSAGERGVGPGQRASALQPGGRRLPRDAGWREHFSEAGLAAAGPSASESGHKSMILHFHFR